MESSKTILIIDDSNTSLTLLEWSLEKAGFNTVLALSVSEAQKIIKKTKPDMILLDLMMPNVSGYDFLKMRSEMNINKIPIIIVSAYDSNDSVKQAQDLGANEFISKPFKIEQIVNVAKKYLGG